MWYPILVAAFAAYLLGNLNGSVCISALVADDDVRKHGSGNAGLTNFFRSYGGANTLLVILVDVGKTVAACLMCGLILAPYGYEREGVILGAAAVSLGHDFPALLGFRGGKGILCGITIAFVVDWRIGLLAAAVFALSYGISKYVSLGSVLGAVAVGIGFGIFQHDNRTVMIGGILLSLLAVWMHRSNLVRLVRGKETKTYLFQRKKDS